MNHTPKTVAVALALLLLIASLATFPAHADITTYNKASLTGTYRQVKPQAVPTSLTAVVAGVDAYLDGIVIVIPAAAAASGVTVTIQDGQGTPIPLIPAITTGGASVSVGSFPFGYWCPGGISIQASGAGTYFYASWRQ